MSFSESVIVNCWFVTKRILYCDFKRRIRLMIKRTDGSRSRGDEGGTTAPHHISEGNVIVKKVYAPLMENDLMYFDINNINGTYFTWARKSLFWITFRFATNWIFILFLLRFFNQYSFLNILSESMQQEEINVSFSAVDFVYCRTKKNQVLFFS